MRFDVNYVNPEAFWLLLMIPAALLIFALRRKSVTPVLRLPSVPASLVNKPLSFLRKWIFLLRLLAIAFVITALARPQSNDVSTSKQGSEGIDIVLAVDISPSMLARDLQPNRLEALKRVAQSFVDGRPSDRMGLVIYAGEAFAQVPLTTDHKVLKNALEELKYDLLDPGTAIGMGLATAVNRLKDSEAISKVVILLTDGENNKGLIDPKTAAELAGEQNIKVYTIGVGTKGFAETPVALDMQGRFVYRSMPVNIDEDLLKYIAAQTNGRYFRATDNQSLREIYEEIDKLEKSKVEEFTFYRYQEHFRPFVLWALGLIVLEFLIRLTLFRSAV